MKRHVPKRRVRIVKPDGLVIRTSNGCEAMAIERLVEKGYDVMRRGWPDLMVEKDGETRLIEIKDHNGKLSKYQLAMAAALARYGLEVEVWPNGEERNRRSWRSDLTRRRGRTRRWITKLGNGFASRSEESTEA